LYVWASACLRQEAEHSSAAEDGQSEHMAYGRIGDPATLRLLPDHPTECGTVDSNKEFSTTMLTSKTLYIRNSLLLKIRRIQ
jgi:hypothetical protein